MKVEEDKCPICGGELEYGESGIIDEGVFYEVSCPKCGFSGKEWYRMEFDGYIDYNDNDYNICNIDRIEQIANFIAETLNLKDDAETVIKSILRLYTEAENEN